MKTLTAITTILITAVALAACGGTDTTTTVEKVATTDPVTTTTTTTTEEAVTDEEWPSYMQRAFIGGCGEGRMCYCALREMEQKVTTEQMVAAGARSAKLYKPEIQEAISACL